MEKELHIPVLLKEVEEGLALKKGDVVVDATLGWGGHSLMMAEKIGDSGHLIALDQDQLAIVRAKDRLKDVQSKISIVKSNFSQIDVVLNQLNINEVDAVLFDIGVSSMQFDEHSRGFSFKGDDLLDMRMDQSQPFSAQVLVNTYSEQDLAKILWELAEEKYSRKIASAIVRTRAARKIETTKELADLIVSVVPNVYGKQRIHPATKSFQAFRMVVNRELDVLKEGIRKAFDVLKISGRMAVISFHSLEDRIVKEFFRELESQGKVRILTKKPIKPTIEEKQKNSRSRSACLRMIERIL